jgi:hypothetical protein
VLIKFKQNNLSNDKDNELSMNFTESWWLVKTSIEVDSYIPFEL